MATEVGSGYITILPKLSSNFNSSLNSAMSSAGSGSSATFSGKFKGGLGTLGVAAGALLAKGISSAVGVVSSSVSAAVSKVDILENFPRTMSNLGISTEAAQASINKMNEKLRGLPTTLQAGASAVQRFTSVNNNVGKSTDMFLALNNAILAGGASAELQASALEQVSQSYSKGRMDMLEWRTMLQAMPAQVQQVAKAMGMSSDELGEGLRKGTISMDQFMDTVMQLNEQGAEGFASFAEQAKTATGGIGTALTNLRTRIAGGVASIITSIGQTNIASAINTFSAAAEKMISAFAPLGSQFGIYLGSISTKFAQYLPKAQSYMEQFVSYIQKNVLSAVKPVFNGMANSLKVILPVVKGLAGVLFSAGDAILKFVNENKKLVEVLTSITGVFLITKLGFSSLANAVLVAKSGIVGFGSSAITTFNTIKGTITQATLQVQGFINVWNGVNSSGGILGMLEVASVKFPKLTNSIISLNTAVGTGFRAAANILSTGFSKLGSSLMKLFLNPVGIAIGVIGALVAAFVLLYKNSETFRNGINGIGQTILGVLKPAIESIKPILDIAIGQFNIFVEQLRPCFDLLAQVFSDTFSELQPVVSELIATLSETFAGLVTELAPVFLELANTLVPILTSVFKTVMDVVRAVFPLISQLAELIARLAVPIMAIIGAIIGGPLVVIIGTIVSLIEALVPVISTLISAVLPVVASIIKVIADVLEAVVPVIAELINVVLPPIISIVTEIFNVLSPLIDFILGYVVVCIQNVTDIIKAVCQVLTGDFEGAANTFNGIWQRIVGFVGGAIENLKNVVFSGLQNVISFFAELPGKIWNILSSLPSILFDLGKRAIQSLIDGLVSMVGNVASAVGGIFGNIQAPFQLVPQSPGGGVPLPRPGDSIDSNDLFGSSSDIDNLNYGSIRKKLNFMDGLDIGNSRNSDGNDPIVNKYDISFYDTPRTPDAIARQIKKINTYGLARTYG